MLRTTSTNVLFYVSSQQGYIRQQRTTRRRLNIMVFTKIKTGQSEIRSSCSAFPTTTEQLLLLVLPLQPGQVINSASMSSLTLHCIRVKSLPLDPGQSSPIIIAITSRSGPIIILVKFYIFTASWSSFITASLSGPIIITSVFWSIRYRRSLVKSSTRITNLVKSYITTSF